MEVARAQESVRQHRTRIDRHIDAAVALLRKPPVIARYPLSLARWRLVALLREYHLFKQGEIFEPAMRSGSLSQVREAEQMLHVCREGWSAYCAYTADWSGKDVVALWPAYTLAMRAMAAQLHEHVAREEALIADLLATSERTRYLVHRDCTAGDCPIVDVRRTRA